MATSGDFNLAIDIRVRLISFFRVHGQRRAADGCSGAVVAAVGVDGEAWPSRWPGRSPKPGSSARPNRLPVGVDELDHHRGGRSSSAVRNADAERLSHVSWGPAKSAEIGRSGRREPTVGAGQRRPADRRRPLGRTAPPPPVDSIASIAGMATLTIRDVDEELRAKLRVRAVRHGRSMEAEVRAILHDGCS